MASSGQPPPPVQPTSQPIKPPLASSCGLAIILLF